MRQGSQQGIGIIVDVAVTIDFMDLTKRSAAQLTDECATQVCMASLCAAANHVHLNLDESIWNVPQKAIHVSRNPLIDVCLY